jgi:hypothetical protein
MSFVFRRQVIAPSAPVASPAPVFDPQTGVYVALGSPNQVVATQVLVATDDGVRGIPHLVAVGEGVVHLGRLSPEHDVVLLAWTRAPVASAGRLIVTVWQATRLLVTTELSPHVAASVPPELGDAESVYIIRVSVGDESLRHESPPPGAIVTLESLAAWLG